MTGAISEQAIIQLRDRAMTMLKEGNWHDDGKGHRALIRETDDLRLAYAGPFQRWAEGMPEQMQHFAGANGKSEPVPHMLSIWRKTPSQKVLNVTWSDDGRIELITFKRGDWETRLA
jgi:hypothetical protein